MNTPHYALIIDVRIKGVKETDDIVMRLKRLVPFPPQAGIVIELWREATEEDGDTYQIPLDGVVYSFRDSAFLIQIDDEDAVDAYREGSSYIQFTKDLVEWYASFGFMRLNYPTVQIANPQ